METLRTNTMLWVWEECLGFSKIQPDLNLSIVFCILTLSGALLRRCSNFDQLLTPVSYLLCTKQEFGLFLSPRKKKNTYKGGRQTLFPKARLWLYNYGKKVFVQLQPGTFQRRKFSVPCSLVQWLFIQRLRSYIYIYKSLYAFIWCHVSPA